MKSSEETMCGLFASITKKDIKHDQILHALSRRGPDAHGEYSTRFQNIEGEYQLNLFHKRLSIIDPKPESNQPFHHPNKNLTIVYNGEIYNYLEIKKELENLGHSFQTKSDTEVLLCSYLEWKEKCIQKLRGIFSFCIWDHQENSLFIARDHLGVKPLYLLNHGNEFAISSTIETLLASGLVNHHSLCQEAINHYLRYGSYDGKNTILNQIKMFPSGHFAIFKNNQLKIESYWNLNLSDKPLDISYEETIKSIKEILQKTTQLQMRADVDVGAFLSGGIDSGMLVGLMSEYTDKPINTFSIGFEGNNQLTEWNLAKLTANKFKTKHHEIKIDEDNFINSLDEFISAIDHPSVDGLNSFFVARETAKNLKVAISGLGGDEVFAGYYFYPKIYASAYSKFPKKQLLDMIPSHYMMKGNLYPTKYLNEILNRHRIIKPAPEYNLINDSLPIEDNLYLSTTSIHELKNYTSNTLLRDVDAVSMYNSLEVRVPFLDPQLIEFLLKIPDQYKISSKYNKPLLIDAFPNLLPKEIINAPKKGFEMPIGQWIEKSFSSQLDSLPPKYNFLGIDENIIKKSIQIFRKNKNHYVPIWRFIVLMLWLERNKIN